MYSVLSGPNIYPTLAMLLLFATSNTTNSSPAGIYRHKNLFPIKISALLVLVTDKVLRGKLCNKYTV